MAKSLGEINYEYLIEFFGAVEGHEDFFTSDDGDEVLVIPVAPRAHMSSETFSTSTRSDGTAASGAVSSRRRIGLFERLFNGIAAFCRIFARRM